MKRRYFNLFNLLVLFLLLVLNLVIYLNRNDGYAYREFLSYDQLYHISEEPRVKGFTQIGEDSLVVLMEPEKKDGSWAVKLPGKVAYSGNSRPVIPLEPGKHLYRINNDHDPSSSAIELGLNFTPSKTYSANGRTRPSVTEIYYCNAPLGDYRTWSLHEWRQGSQEILEEEITLARNLITAKALVKKEDSSLVKIQKIAVLILSELESHRGIPSDSMDALSAWQRFNHARQGKSKVWCGDLSAIFSFFLSCEGIVSREVCLEGMLNKVNRAGHSFNEIYIGELNQWVMSDLTAKNIYTISQGKVLNTLNFFALHQNGAPGLRSLTTRNDSLATVDYQQMKPFYDYYFSPGTQFVYYFNSHYQPGTYSALSKLKRYFTPSAEFATYAGTSVNDNKKFYYKQLVACLLLFFLAYLGSLTIYLRFLRKKEAQIKSKKTAIYPEDTGL